MIDDSELQELAAQGRESPETLVARLGELRARGATILESVKYVRWNQGCDLPQAVHLVVDSPVWEDRREAYWREQEEAFLAFLHSQRERIQSLEMTLTPDGTNVVARFES